MAVSSRLKIVIMERNLERAREGQPALTLRQLSADTGLALSTITGLTANRARRVDFATLNILCRYLSVQPGDLLEYVPDE